MLGLLAARKTLVPAGILGIGVAVSLLLLGSAPSAELRPPDETPLSTRTLTVQTETVRLHVESQGTVAPRTETTLVAPVAGEVAEVLDGLEPGAFFRAGEVLARLDRRDYELARRRAAAALARARAEEAFAHATLERQLVLRANGIASDAVVDEARRAAEVASTMREEREVDVERAERDLARTEIVAPFDGRTRLRQADIGRFVNVGTPLAVVYAVDHAEVRLPVPDTELAFLELPLGSELEPPDAPAVDLHARFAGVEHHWRGHIVRTEAAIDPRTRMVHAIARVPRPFDTSDGRPPLAPGLYVEARIEGREVPGLARVPRSVLDDGHVWLVGPEDRLERRRVSVLRLERDTALVARGLAANDRLSLIEPRLAREGLAVAPIEADSLAARTEPLGSSEATPL